MTAGLRDRLAAGELLLGGFLVLNAPLAGEVLGAAGLDWALVDMEHGATSDADLLAHLHATAASGLAGLVRVESGERPRSGRALDLGAEGIMFPRVDSAADAAAAVAHLRYPPDGDRGVATSHRAAGFGLGDTAAAMRELPLAIVQIESPTAVAAAREIAAVPGVDVLFVGPRDLRHALAAAGEPPERFDESLVQVLEAARAAGVATGIFLPS
ncbi:MAG TPA: aldolase/citrate lyase family protein, partial [Conexibacter sp.]|nr:aldolase/citrate lyase family protein [Conexibacter sp.]